MCGKCFAEVLFKINYHGVEMLHCICGWKTDETMEFNRVLQANDCLPNKITQGGQYGRGE